MLCKFKKAQTTTGKKNTKSKRTEKPPTEPKRQHTYSLYSLVRDTSSELYIWTVPFSYGITAGVASKPISLAIMKYREALQSLSSSSVRALS